MSNIPRARGILREALREGTDLETAILRALRFMTRVKYIRLAPPKRTVITKVIRYRVKRMARENPDMTLMQIAVQSGLRSQGRVSEILHGKR